MYKTISWNTGLAAERARHNLKLKKYKLNRYTLNEDVYIEDKSPKPKAASRKLQASSATKKTQ